MQSVDVNYKCKLTPCKLRPDAPLGEALRVAMIPYEWRQTDDTGQKCHVACQMISHIRTGWMSLVLVQESMTSGQHNPAQVGQ